jgi:FkbM family methyltransferase
MKIDCSPAEFVEELNCERDHLKYSFAAGPRFARLRVEPGHVVAFPADAGGRIAGGSSQWIRHKHREGLIHEPAMVAAVVALSRRLVQSPVTFFDVGALYGYFSLLARALFTQSTVVAFEVNPESYAALRRNAAANATLGYPPIRCCNAALSDHSEFGHRSNIDDFVFSEKVENGGGIPVDLLSLDDYCRLTDVQPDLMKIDVEGYQAKILPGAMRVIEASRPVILLEFDHPNHLSRFGCSNYDVVKPLFDLGYRLIWCSDQRGRSGRFEYVAQEDMSDEHEHNSLAVLAQFG